MYSNSLYYITLLYVFTCLYNYIDIVLCTVYFVFVLTFPHPGLYWIHGNKDDDDDDDDDEVTLVIDGYEQIKLLRLRLYICKSNRCPIDCIKQMNIGTGSTLYIYIYILS
jgi:hypothetical protein